MYISVSQLSTKQEQRSCHDMLFAVCAECQ